MTLIPNPFDYSKGLVGKFFMRFSLSNFSGTSGKFIFDPDLRSLQTVPTIPESLISLYQEYNFIAITRWVLFLGSRSLTLDFWDTND
jgi:hypothetical protein